MDVETSHAKEQCEKTMAASDRKLMEIPTMLVGRIREDR